MEIRKGRGERGVDNGGDKVKTDEREGGGGKAEGSEIRLM